MGPVTAAAKAPVAAAATTVVAAAAWKEEGRLYLFCLCVHLGGIFLIARPEVCGGLLKNQKTEYFLFLLCRKHTAKSRNSK